MYALLTPEVRSRVKTSGAGAMRHINEPPPPVRDKRPDVSPRLDAAIQKAMAKNPEDRFQTMADFCRELEPCLAEVQSGGATQVAAPAQRRSARRRGMNPWPVLLVLAAL